MHSGNLTHGIPELERPTNLHLGTPVGRFGRFVVRQRPTPVISSDTDRWRNEHGGLTDMYELRPKCDSNRIVPFVKAGHARHFLSSVKWGHALSNITPPLSIYGWHEWWRICRGISVTGFCDLFSQIHYVFLCKRLRPNHASVVEDELIDLITSLAHHISAIASIDDPVICPICPLWWDLSGYGITLGSPRRLMSAGW